MVETQSQSATFDIRPVATDGDRELFLDVPQHVYANDPNWVPPIRSSIAKEFSSTNTFFEYGTLQQFIALRPDSAGKPQPIGRIVAAINRRLIERENQPVGLIGYFECINDFAVAQGLFQAACDWLRSNGITIARGPIDLSTHNRCLCLVDGFDTPPKVMMPYNPSYYPQFFEKDGWYKGKDAYSYMINVEIELPPLYEKGYRIACKSGIEFRRLNVKGEAFWEDVKGIYDLFTKAFANNYSSSARTLEEFLEEAKDLKDLVDPDIFWIAEYKGEMVGFFMALPDYNIALKHVNGKLDIWGILKFLWFRRQIDQARILVICSLPEHQRRMVPFGLIHLALKYGGSKSKPYKRTDIGHVFEDNLPSRRVIEAAGSQIDKTYRIYEKAL
ncbi:MAG: hypothetical protein WBA57_16425 [Elainellaceae cyanobacterium]